MDGQNVCNFSGVVKSLASCQQRNALTCRVKETVLFGRNASVLDLTGCGKTRFGKAL